MSTYPQPCVVADFKSVEHGSFSRTAELVVENGYGYITIPKDFILAAGPRNGSIFMRIDRMFSSRQTRIHPDQMLHICVLNNIEVPLCLLRSPRQAGTVPMGHVVRKPEQPAEFHSVYEGDHFNRIRNVSTCHPYIEFAVYDEAANPVCRGTMRFKVSLITQRLWANQLDDGFGPFDI